MPAITIARHHYSGLHKVQGISRNAFETLLC